MYIVSKIIISSINILYKCRWRTLLSVDDLVELVMTRLDKHSLLSNTYVVFTSDNGFHLGNNCLRLFKCALPHYSSCGALGTVCCRAMYAVCCMALCVVGPWVLCVVGPCVLCVVGPCVLCVVGLSVV